MLYVEDVANKSFICRFMGTYLEHKTSKCLDRANSKCIYDQLHFPMRMRLDLQGMPMVHKGIRPLHETVLSNFQPYRGFRYHTALDQQNTLRKFGADAEENITASNINDTQSWYHQLFPSIC